MKFNTEWTTAMISNLKQVQNAMNTAKSNTLYKRYHVIFLHLKGYKNIEIADIVSLNVNTVGIHIKKYKAHGLDGLIPLPKPGYPKKLSPQQEALLINVVTTKTPSDVGLEPYMNWDSKLLRIWVQDQFGVSFSKSGMRDLLIRLGFSYTRPTYTLAKASEEKQEEFLQEFEQLKNFDS